MKANVKAINGSVLHEIELPAVFNEEFRPDLIKRAVLAYQSEQYQPYGANPYAGMRTSAEGWGSKRGESKIPRIKNGSRGAKVPQTKGGHPAHAPKVEKILVRRSTRKRRQRQSGLQLQQPLTPNSSPPAVTSSRVTQQLSLRMHLKHSQRPQKSRRH